MLIYFGIIGLGCLFYYGMIRQYTGKWNSTFAGFWLFFGVLHLCAAALWQKMPVGIQLIVSAGVLLGWVLFLLVEVSVFRDMRRIPQAGAEYLIVLGAHVNGRQITNSLLRRLDAAWEYLQDNPDTKVILSGGQGRGEDISEAEAMAENLMGRGLRADRIICEDRSTSTEENLRFSGELIGRESMTKKIVLVTNDFHLHRALLLGRQIGYCALDGLAASSNPVLKLNYLTREFAAIILTKVRAML